MNLNKATNERAYRINFTRRENFLHAYVEGEEDSVEISRQYWNEVLDECRRRGLDKVLIEENITGNVTAGEMYEFAKELPNLVTDKMVVAFVDRRTAHEEINRFGELVANNRGLKSRVFNTVEDAAAWLGGQ